MIFKDGWHRAEVVAEGRSRTEWQWTKKEATLAFRNPKRDVVLFLDADNPATGRNSAAADRRADRRPGARHRAVSVGAAPVVRKVPISAAQLGAGDMVEMRFVADKTFVPALEPGGATGDTRELGARVFHAFVQ